MKKDFLKSCICFLFIYLFISNSVLLSDQQKTLTDKKKAVSNNPIENKVASETNSNNNDNNYKALKTNVKTGIRSFFENVNKNLSIEDFGELPAGITIIDGEGFRGIKITQGLLEIRAYTWSDDSGLLDNFKKCKNEGDDIVAAINGTFYSERGALGQIIQDGEIPPIKQIPARLSRCFVCAYRYAKNVQYWYLGETGLPSYQLMQRHSKDMVWFNGVADSNVKCDTLLGGGGWILKNRKDAHHEAEDRQFFRFRHEDLTSRKTIVAQDSHRNLYFIVFEAGFTFYQVALTLVKNEVFKDVQDAIFLDGGSSSCIVLNGKYLVAPLYLVDKARFSCIQIIKPEIVWSN